MQRKFEPILRMESSIHLSPICLQVGLGFNLKWIWALKKLQWCSISVSLSLSHMQIFYHVACSKIILRWKSRNASYLVTLIRVAWLSPDWAGVVGLCAPATWDNVQVKTEVDFLSNIAAEEMGRGYRLWHLYTVAEIYLESLDFAHCWRCCWQHYCCSGYWYLRCWWYCCCQSWHCWCCQSWYCW